MVDNNSTDGSREWLESKFPGVIFKWQSTNHGFAKANNSVLNEAKGELVLFLNPDTIIPEDCFEQCIGFFKSNEKCGALGVKMIDGAGFFLKESKRGFPSPIASFFKMSGLSKVFPSSSALSKYHAGHLSEDEINETDVLAGAFFMVRKMVLDKTGSFDEQFFMYAEDIDLSYRIQQAGFKNYYFPSVTIIHFKGESTQRKTGQYIKRFYDAMQLFVKKHYHGKKTVRYLMQASISFGKLLAYCKMFFKKTISLNRSIYTNNRETLVVADQAYFNELIQLVKHAREPLVIQGRVSVKSNDKESSIGSIDSIRDIVFKNKTGKVIFCESPLSFKKMIEVMDQLKGKVDFLFHAKQSESIIASNDKNENGFFIGRP